MGRDGMFITETDLLIDGVIAAMATGASTWRSPTDPRLVGIDQSSLSMPEMRQNAYLGKARPDFALIENPFPAPFCPVRWAFDQRNPPGPGR
jgi:hypothetical protein